MIEYSDFFENIQVIIIMTIIIIIIVISIITIVIIKRGRGGRHGGSNSGSELYTLTQIYDTVANTLPTI